MASPKNQKKRKYTMSDKAIAQRREAAQHSTGPVTEDGKAASSRNAYKHGLYSQANSLIKNNWAVGAFAKPCRSTCQYHPDNPNAAPVYPCTLVIEGYTKAGKDCLDKTVYVQAFDRLLTTLADGNADQMHEILAAEAAGALELLHRLREEIAEHGFIIHVPLIDKKGDVIMLPNIVDGKKEGERPATKPIGNPVMPHYIKMLDAMGINLPELLATPKAVKDVGEKDEQKNALAALLGGALGAVSNGRRGRTFENE